MDPVLTALLAIDSLRAHDTLKAFEMFGVSESDRLELVEHWRSIGMQRLPASSELAAIVKLRKSRRAP